MAALTSSQEQHLATGCFNQVPGLGGLVDAQGIEHHGLAGTQTRDEHVLDKGREDLPVQRPIDHQALPQAICGQCRNPDDVGTMAPRDVADRPLAARRAGTQRGEREGRAGFVQEDQVAWIQCTLSRAPRIPHRRILFDGDQGLLLSGRSSRRSRRLRCEGL